MNARRSSLFLYIIGKLQAGSLGRNSSARPQSVRRLTGVYDRDGGQRVASELRNRAVARKLAGVQKALVKFASERIAADYDDDDWCPTGRVPIPIPVPGPFGSLFEEVLLNPQPLPPKELQREIGGYLLMLSGATSLEGVARDLETIGRSLIRS